jgi:ubiquinone/menaquinone biosynthesis C-methylase UbiE
MIDGVPVLLAALSNQHELQRSYFDAEFSRYAVYQLENWRLSYIERIFEALDVAQVGGPYLDVGTGGSGGPVIEAARVGVEAVGCDLSAEAILAARRFAAHQGVEGLASFVVCTAEQLPFPDRSFGSASAVAVLEHLDDDLAGASELARVLRPGGLAWITVPHAFRWMPPLVWPVYWWHDRRIGHKRHYDEQRLVRLAARAGLEHVRTFFSGHPVKLLQALGASFLPGLRRRGSAWWWRLERLDQHAARRRLGAVHMSIVVRRPR